MPEDSQRIQRARDASNEASQKLLEACDRLSVALDQTEGVPIKEIDEEDSLVIAADGVREHNDEVIESNRSRRMLRRAAR